MPEWIRTGTGPTREFSRLFRRLAHIGALGYRLKPAIRNLGQRLLLTDLYSYKDTLTAQAHQNDGFWPSVETSDGKQVKLDELLNQQDWYKATHKYMSENSETLTNAIGQAGSKLFHAAHMSNVNISARVGYYNWLNHYEQGKDKNSSYYKMVERRVVGDLRKEAESVYESLDSKKKKKLKKQKFIGDYVAEGFNAAMKKGLVTKEDMMPMIRDAVRFTQWEYLPTSMPLHYRSDTAKAAMLFQSWIQNYYGNHLYEAGHRLFTGKDTSGRVLSKSERTRALRGMGIMLGAGKAMEALLGVSILKFLLFPHSEETPPSNAPMFQAVDGLYQAVFAKNERERKAGLEKAKRVFQIAIPGSGLYRDIQKAKEQQSLKPMLFYEKEKE